MMSRALVRCAALSLLGVTPFSLTTAHADNAHAKKPAIKTAGQTISLKLEPTGAPQSLGYYPIPLALATTKPAGITKEPTYTGTPMYGKIHLGNGPNADTLFAVDMPAPAQGDYKIYVDTNHNGDLTDDGTGAWSAKRDGDRAMYGLNHYVLRASYGTSTKETGTGQYGIAMYQFVGQNTVLMYREAAAVGTLTVAGKPHKVYLVENDADGLYSKPITDAGKPVGGGPEKRPVWLLIDSKDDGKFADTDIMDARAPFKFNGKVVVAQIAPNGTKLTLKPTTRVAYAPQEPKAPPLLSKGVAAPDFTATATDGHSIKLSDYKGKVVVLDFWATWCGPCQESMPHTEQVYQAVQGKDVAVLGLCVWDTKAEYDKWIPAHKDQYKFDFAFDPAADNQPKSIASSLYKVSGIPTTYIIGKDGKVVDAVVGYEKGDTRVEAALKKAGVDVGPETTASK